MTDIEKLAIAQGVYKVVAELVSTKNSNGIRGKADHQLMELYDQMGVKSMDLKVSGQKVGTYSVTMAKATPEKQSTALQVNDKAALVAWTKENSDEWNEFVDSTIEAFAQYVFEEYGEVPDGCETVTHVTPAAPEHPKGTTLRVDPQKVADALQGQLPSYVAGLLGGE